MKLSELYKWLNRTPLLVCLVILFSSAMAHAESILFVGNSFTFAYGSPVQFYRNHTVTDLNRHDIGGVPALFKSFVSQAELSYDVFLETEPGVGIDWHLANRHDLIAGQVWDRVVLQSYSTLDRDHPGNPATLIQSVRAMAQLLKEKNPAVVIDLVATWARADQTYQAQGAWFGKPVDAMTNDVRAGYDQAYAAVAGLHAIAPVGQAWLRAMRAGVAVFNPFLPVPPGQIDLWSFDHYHASTYGYYLTALVLFGTVTGHDPRSLGDTECSGYELGMSREQVGALQKVAFEQLSSEGKMKRVPSDRLVNNPESTRCDLVQQK